MSTANRQLKMNLAIAASALVLITLVSRNINTGTEERDTQTAVAEGDKPTSGYFTASQNTTTPITTQPQRINVPVKIKPRIPGKEHAVSEGVFLDPVNREFGTPMPVYKDKMIDMLRDEARDNAPGALSSEEIKKLKKEGNLIW